jgi:hypothetical protein
MVYGTTKPKPKPKTNLSESVLMLLFMTSMKILLYIMPIFLSLSSHRRHSSLDVGR